LESVKTTNKVWGKKGSWKKTFCTLESRDECTKTINDARWIRKPEGTKKKVKGKKPVSRMREGGGSNKKKAWGEGKSP